MEWEIKRNGQGFDVCFGEYEENDLECIEHVKMKDINKIEVYKEILCTYGAER